MATKQAPEAGVSKTDDTKLVPGATVAEDIRLWCSARRTLRAMNRRNARKMPDDAPTGFLHPRWKSYVLIEAGADRSADLRTGAARGSGGENLQRFGMAH